MRVSDFGLKYKLQKAVLIVLSVLLSLFIAEFVLRMVYPQQDELYVWQPHLQHTFHPDSNIFYGIKEETNFSINEQGFRGSGFENNSGDKYLCIGGSTTECLYLSDNDTWCSQLELYLNRKLPTANYQLGSIGKSGCTTRENYLHLKHYVPQLEEIKGVVMMVGLNDMMKRLSRDSLFENDFHFTASVEDSMVKEIFISDKKQSNWWRNLRVFKLAQQALHRTQKVKWQNVQDDTGVTLQQWRANRKQATSIIDSLPDLSSALDEFERNLQLIFAETQKQKINLTLINQAVLYKDSMSVFENNLLWMGGVGNFQQEINHAYYSASALNKAASLYNERMKNFCSAYPQIKFIDLVAQLPKDTSVFYDDCHFNESGARKVAAILAPSFINSSK